MPKVKLFASTILGAFEAAQSELVGKGVILTDGKAGTVENVWLDELHGLRISIGGHDGRWPISTIKFAEAGEGELACRTVARSNSIEQLRCRASRPRVNGVIER